MLYRLQKSDVPRLLDELAMRYEAVYAPIRGIGGDVFLEQYGSGELALDYGRLPVPPKELFFPRVEEMFSYRDGEIMEPEPLGRLAAFGIRSCDVAALKILDEFFQRDYEDALYTRRRRDSLLISIACNKPEENCFCTSADGAPFVTEGVDLQFFDIDDTYIVEVLSERGGLLVRDLASLFSEAPEEDTPRLEALKSDLPERVKLSVPLQEAAKMLAEGEAPEDVWAEYAAACLTCGGCSYLCPTCTCFNVIDVGDRSEGTRYRTWDSCVLGGFTREASGHNPRPTEGSRCARRYEHKLKYSVPAYGYITCVGCGRCVAACISRMGMVEAVRALLEARTALQGRQP